MAQSEKVNGSLAMAIVVAAKTTRALFWPHMAAVGLGPPRPLVIGVLLEHDGLTQTQIASIINSDAPAITKCLRGLQDEGLITRERDPRDTRVQRVKLTKLGHSCGPALEQAWARASTELFEPLDHAERKELQRLLDKLSGHHRHRSKNQVRDAAA